MGTVAELLTCQDTSADWQGHGSEPSGSCCWPGRRGRIADLHGTPAQTGRDVAESHREIAAGKEHRGGAAAGSEVVQYHREENTGKDASKEEQLRDACRV